MALGRDVAWVADRTAVAALDCSFQIRASMPFYRLVRYGFMGTGLLALLYFRGRCCRQEKRDLLCRVWLSHFRFDVDCGGE